MHRIQKLLSVAALIALAACGKSEPVVSVTDYLNDYAMLRATTASCSLRDDRDTNQSCLNAVHAMGMIVTGAFSKCYLDGKTDKACVAAVLAKSGK